MNFTADILLAGGAMFARCLCLLLSVSIPAVCQTAAEIVAAVSDRYEELDKACSMTVTTEQANRTNYREDRFQLTVQGDLARLVDTTAKPITWITGEEFVWFFNAGSHFYAKTDRDSPESEKARQLINARREMLLTRFIRMNDIHTKLTLKGEQNIRSHRCLRIWLESVNKDSTQEIWVEPSTHLVWKLVQHWPGTAQYQTILWRKIEPGQPPGSQFQLTQP